MKFEREPVWVPHAFLMDTYRYIAQKRLFVVYLWVMLVVKYNRNVLIFHGDNESGRSRLGRVGTVEVQTLRMYSGSECFSSFFL